MWLAFLPSSTSSPENNHNININIYVFPYRFTEVILAADQKNYHAWQHRNHENQIKCSSFAADGNLFNFLLMTVK